MLECFATGRLNMNQKDRSGSCFSLEGSIKAETKAKSYNVSDWNHHYHGSRNSAEDPKVTSSRADKHLSSNARNHPQADVQGRGYSHVSSGDLGSYGHVSSGDSGQRKKLLSSASANYMYNHVNEKVGKGKSCDSSPHNGKRRQSHERDDGEWTAHESSSSGRIYYYNKRLDKSQWETPKGMVKRARTDSAQLSSSMHHEGHRGEGDRIRGSGYTYGGNHDPGHAHRDKTSGYDGVWEGGVARMSSSSRRGGNGHEDDGKRQRDRRSLNYSHSSPVGSSKRTGSNNSIDCTASRGGQHGLKIMGSTHPRSVAGGNSYGGGGGSRDRAGKTHQASLGLQRGYHSCHASPSAGSTPKRSVGTPGIQLISPTTPGGVPSCIPSSLSHTLTTTQQLIDQNSLLIEQRQKLLLAGETTPTIRMTTPTSTPNMAMVSTPPSHHLIRPQAKKRLALTPHQAHSPSGHAHSMGMTTPTKDVYIRGGVTFPGKVDRVLTPSQGTPSLHPLQKALLLQNQRQQQQQQEQLQQQRMPPTSYYSRMPNHAHPVTPTALPPHMTSMPSSHPSSPGLQSPSITSQGAPATPVYLVNVQPVTPVVQRPGMFMAHANLDSAAAMPSYQLISSSLLQRPMSRLGYQGVSMFDSPFPSQCGLMDLSVVTRVDSNLMDRGLAEVWIQHHEIASKHVEQCRIETWRRRVVEAMYLSGRLAERRLSLEGVQVRTFSRGQRLACVQGLVHELDKK